MPRAFVCVDCGQEGEHHLSAGVPPKRCPPCKAEYKRAYYRESYAQTRQLIGPRGAICVCIICGEVFVAETIRAQVCHEVECRKKRHIERERARREANAGKGVVCHCGEMVAAKGLCPYHYNASRREMVGRQEKPKLLTCAACGVDVVKSQTRTGRQVVCSTWCRYFVTHGRWPSSALTPPLMPTLTRRERAQQKLDRAAIGTTGSSTWYSGRCRECGAWVTSAQPMIRTCSKRCARKAGRDRRRAREHDAFVAPVYRLAIYERDKWTCQLCKKKLKRTAVVPHPLAPTIDHVIPLADGGTHEPANCHAAHFICNARKSAGGGGEQLALIG